MSSLTAIPSTPVQVRESSIGNLLKLPRWPHSVLLPPTGSKADH
jgi:hypothetical protein